MLTSFLACGHGNLLGWLLLKCAKLGKYNRARGAILFYQSLTLLSHVATSKYSRSHPLPLSAPSSFHIFAARYPQITNTL